ncbi:ArnT family glycosyltransferase [Prolixibacter bellariivorans]|nr:glycosyltransferase family 39 protein [Prolixibacter bellariivorans]
MKTGKYLPIFLFFAAFFLYTAGIRYNPIYILDESKNVECAREMFTRNDLVVPTFNDRLRTDKPPLHYYFMMASFKIFGVNEFAARFFSAIMGALTLLITFLFTKKYAGEKTALLTWLILITSLNFSIEFHLAVPDPYLIFFMTLTHWAFFEFYQNRKWPWLITMYAALGLAILAKGPVALGFAGLNGLLFLIMKRDFRWKTIKQFRLLLGVVVTGLIAIPWYVKVGLATHGEWTRQFFFKHNLDRFSSEMEGHGGFFLLTAIFVLLAFLPYTIFLFQSYREAFRQRKNNDLILFSMIVSLVIIVFFSISSTQLPNYPMPAYPFVAVLIGYYLSNVNLKMKKPLWISLIIGLLIPIGAFIAMKLDKSLVPVANMAWFFLVIPAGSVWALYNFYQQRSQQRIFTALSAGWIMAGILFFMVVFPAVNRQNPVQKALTAMDISRPVAYYGRFNPAFAFALKKHIPQMKTPEEVSAFFQEHPNGYLISITKVQKELEALPLKEIVRQKDLFENKTTQVYQWKP